MKSNKVRKNSADRWTHCFDCKYKFGDINEKGNLVRKASSGYCKSCYQRNYSKKLKRKCESCSREIISMKKICKVCYAKQALESPTRYMIKKLQSNRNKEKMSKVVLDITQYELVRRLLVKWKRDILQSIDYFIVADIYVDIFECDTFLDSCSQEEQVIIMLGRLEEIWKNNYKEKDEPKKVRK